MLVKYQHLMLPKELQNVGLKINIFLKLLENIDLTEYICKYFT